MFCFFSFLFLRFRNPDSRWTLPGNVINNLSLGPQVIFQCTFEAGLRYDFSPSFAIELIKNEVIMFLTVRSKREGAYEMRALRGQGPHDGAFWFRWRHFFVGPHIMARLAGSQNIS